MTNRREFLSSFLASAPLLAQTQRRRPNIILILTDDQGYGDLSIHGNPYLKTPNLDSIAKDGVQFTQFQVCPVCSPTRSSLMTGRYNYRTGAIDTFLGRSMMYPDEVTLAEVLGGAGYQTGIWGKWHLGDNYPMRAMDQGFQESLVHRGGGIGQNSDPPGSSYFDPILFHNGKQVQRRGYCTDVFFNSAMEWIEAHKSEPFFAYLPTNAPHGPLQIDEAHVAPFRRPEIDQTTAKVYGMVANIDENIGRLLARLRALGLERDTILIFITDNGPTPKRYNAGMRGIKTGVYQGGIRVPCFVRWPARLRAGDKVDRIAAHIDVFPTLLEACGVARPAGVRIDGRSLLPLAEGKAGAWPDRMLFTQWHRGDQPEPFRNCAVRTQRYKLVDGKELYDLEADPGEKQDIAAANPEVVARQRAGYEEWFRDVSSVRHYAPPRIYIGTSHENPVVLTRQDWRTPPEPGAAGPPWWEVDVRRACKCDIALTLDPIDKDTEAYFELGATSRKLAVAKGAAECRFTSVPLPAGPGQLKAYVRSGPTSKGARFVELRTEPG
jgi:arylsulfatase A-like enzyme